MGLGGGVSGPGGVSLSRRRRKKRRRVRSSYPLTHVLLDFQSVVGVDGSAIAVFEKLRRFAAREGVVLVLSGLGDRPELRRLTRIALYGETTPTFAFVDRSSANRGAREDWARRFCDDESVKVLASDPRGLACQVADLDDALRVGALASSGRASGGTTQLPFSVDEARLQGGGGG